MYVCQYICCVCAFFVINFIHHSGQQMTPTATAAANGILSSTNSISKPYWFILMIFATQCIVIWNAYMLLFSLFYSLHSFIIEIKVKKINFLSIPSIEIKAKNTGVATSSQKRWKKCKCSVKTSSILHCFRHCSLDGVIPLSNFLPWFLSGWSIRINENWPGTVIQEMTLIAVPNVMLNAITRLNTTVKLDVPQMCDRWR